MGSHGALARVRKRKGILLGGAVAATGAVLLYRAYHSDRLAKLLQTYATVKKGLQQYGDALLAGGEVTSLLLQDLRHFLQSDQQEVPQSIRQMALLLQSDEAQNVAASLITATAQGLATASQAPAVQQALQRASNGAFSGGAASASCSSSASSSSPQTLSTYGASGQKPDALDRILQALTSQQGVSLVSLAVGVAARSSTQAYCECVERAASAAAAGGQPSALAESALPQLFRWAATPEGERFCAVMADTFARGGSEVYIERTQGVNPWTDLFAALAHPSHREVGAHMTRSFVNELMCTWLHPTRPADRASIRPAMAATTLAANLHRLSAAHTISNVVCRLQQQAQLRAQLPVPHPDGPSTPVQQVTKQAGSPLVISQGTASMPGSSKGKQRGRAAIRLSASTAELGLAPGLPSAAGALHVVARSALGPDGAAGDLDGAGDSQGSTFASQVLQVMRNPEARLVMFSMTTIALSEGIRTGWQLLKDGTQSQAMLLQKQAVMLGLPARQAFVAACLVLMLCWLLCTQARHLIEKMPFMAR